MSGLVEELRRHHDRLNCHVEEISGTRFKTDTERDAEIESAMSLCWRAADEITRLTARVAELEGGIKKALDVHKRNFGHQTEKLADIAPILRDALEPKP